MASVSPIPSPRHNPRLKAEVGRLIIVVLRSRVWSYVGSLVIGRLAVCSIHQPTDLRLYRVPAASPIENQGQVDIPQPELISANVIACAPGPDVAVYVRLHPGVHPGVNRRRASRQVVAIGSEGGVVVEDDRETRGVHVTQRGRSRPVFLLLGPHAHVASEPVPAEP